MSLARQIVGAAFSGLCAGLGSLAAALVGSESIGQVTDGQWVAIALATLLASGGVLGFTRSSSSSSSSSKP